MRRRWVIDWQFIYGISVIWIAVWTVAVFAIIKETGDLSWWVPVLWWLPAGIAGLVCVVLSLVALVRRLRYDPTVKRALEPLTDDLRQARLTRRV